MDDAVFFNETFTREVDYHRVEIRYDQLFNAVIKTYQLRIL